MIESNVEVDENDPGIGNVLFVVEYIKTAFEYVMEFKDEMKVKAVKN